MSWEDDAEEKEYDSIGKVEVVAESDKALKVKRADGKIAWLPKSVVEDNSPASKGEAGEMFVARWFCKKEGL